MHCLFVSQRGSESTLASGMRCFCASGVLARREYARLRAQVAAAITIQAAYRGYRGRQVALDVKKEAMATILQVCISPSSFTL